MKSHFVSLLWLLLFTSYLFVSGCGGSDDLGSSPAPVIGSSPQPNPPPQTQAPSTPDETISAPLLVGKSTQLSLDFPGGHSCVDGTTPIQWTLTADASRASISQTNICRPVLATTAQFQGGDATIEARIRRADGKWFRWSSLIGLKRTPEIATGLLARSRAQWGSISVPPTTSNFREVSIQTIPTAQMVLGSRFSNSADDGTVVFWEGSDRTVNRRFEFPIQFQDPDGEAEKLSVSVSCKMNDPNRQRFLLECPFDFDPVTHLNPLVKFRFKEDIEAVPYSNLFRVKNVFRHSSSQYSIIDIIVEVRHPNTSEVARRTVAQIALYTYFI